MKNSLIDNQGFSLPNEKKTKLESQLLSKKKVLTKMGAFKLNFPVAFVEIPTYLKDFQCPHCNYYLTDEDINQNNYNLWVINEISEITKTENIYSFGDGKPAYEMNFRLRAVGHRNCSLKGGNN
jgi:hypothetical protein